jgi:hypothetical protein
MWIGENKPDTRISTGGDSTCFAPAGPGKFAPWHWLTMTTIAAHTHMHTTSSSNTHAHAHLHLDPYSNSMLKNTGYRTVPMLVPQTPVDFGFVLLNGGIHE